jgi:hypothetical protein
MVASVDPSPNINKARSRATFAWCCVALLVVSYLMPVANAPIVGNVTVFGLQDNDAYYFVAFAVLAALGAYLRRYELCAISGALVAGTTLYYIFRLQESKAELATSLDGNMFSGLAMGLASTIHVDYGAGVLLLAGVALVTTLFLRNDATNFRDLFETNRLSFLRGGAVLAVMAVVIALLPTMLSKKTSFMAAATPAKTRPRIESPTQPKGDAKLLAMQQISSVGLLQKGFETADADAGRYGDDFTVTMQYHNLGNKTITGMKGTLDFYDQFDTRFWGFKVEYEKALAPGVIATEDLTYDYNQFEEKDQKLRDTPLNKLRVVWTPKRINFADGSSLSDAQ